MGTVEHKQAAPTAVTIGIVTVSTTRTLETDESGGWIRDQAESEGHTVVGHTVVKDDAAAVRAALEALMRQASPQVVVLNGGTGISPGDVTIEAVGPMFSKEMTAFGALFSQLSFGEIGSAAVLSRAAAGVVRETVVFCLPGSVKACRLAWRELIAPELGHLVHHARGR